MVFWTLFQKFTEKMKYNNMNEFDFIEKYLSSKQNSNKFSLNFKDDVGHVNNNIFSTDTICEGIHFFSEDDPSMVAKKLIRVNISDIVAKGIRPMFCLLNLSLGKKANIDWLDKFMKGFHSDLDFYKLNLIGGDTTKTLQKSVLSLTIFANLKGKKFIKRSSSKKNDFIYVTGSIGDSSLGLYLRKNKNIKISKKHSDYLINRYLLPQPRIDLVNFINKNASASTDISDGLYSDLSNICKTSNLGSEIYFSKIPLSDAAIKIIKDNPLLAKNILSGGDDYEVLFTGPPNLDRKKNVTKIGKMITGNKIKLIDFDDRISLDGYKHEI